MLSVHLRPVGEDGAIGPALGTAFLRDGTVVYEGATMLAEQLAAIAARFRITETEALTRLAVDGWSNGKMVISADAG